MHSAPTAVPAAGAQAPVLPAGHLTLKYLFIAQFADGTIIEQTLADKSATAPGRTAFYDLLALDEQGEQIQHPAGGGNYCRNDIVLFQLVDDQGTRYLVDLKTGEFEIQYVTIEKKKPVLKGNAFYLAFPEKGKRLIPYYFRRRRHHMQVTATVQQDKSIDFGPAHDETQECEYHFGWETEDRAQRIGLILV